MVRTCKKVEYTTSKLYENKRRFEEAINETITRYKEIIFGSDAPACMACLDELQKQQIIYQKIYDQKLMEDIVRKLVWEGLQRNIVIDGDTMTEKKTGEVLNSEVNSTYWKDKF